MRVGKDGNGKGAAQDGPFGFTVVPNLSSHYRVALSGHHGSDCGPAFRFAEPRVQKKVEEEVSCACLDDDPLLAC